MDRLVKWALGCAVWMILCSGAQAGLIDSVRVGDKAYLLSDSHLYLYDAPGGSVDAAIALPDSPVALAVSDTALFVAYSNRIEKRDFDGVLVSDPVSGEPVLSRNLTDVQDIAIDGANVYVSFIVGGEPAFHELNAADLSPVAGAGAPYFTLSEPMTRLVPSRASGGLVFYSPLGKDLGMLAWPSTPDAEGVLPVLESEVSESSGPSLAPAENLFILDNPDPQILMDNGSGWKLDGEQTIGWIAGKDFKFMDQSLDGDWSVVRGKVSACETGDALNWASDLSHYEADALFESRNKVGEPGAPFEVVHLWGTGDPVAHLFRESAPGELFIESMARSEGLPFDDGAQPYPIEADETLSSYQLENGVTHQHVALDDELGTAYVLHQGAGSCQAAIRVYDLENDEWIDTIPLRWRPVAIAMLGGSTMDASDDQLAVVYETAYNYYGRSNILVSFIDVNAAEPAEDPSTDFLEYNITYSGVSTVQASRHSVLFQVENSQRASVITAWNPQRVKATYEDCEATDPCDNPRDIDLWESRATLGGQAGLILKAGDDIRLLQFTEDGLGFAFEDPYQTHRVLDDSVVDADGPLQSSPDLELFTLSLGESTALFHRSSQAFSEGKATDFLPIPMDVATWSETAQGAAGSFALYSLTGGDVEGTTAAQIQRWVMGLGSDGHFEFQSASEADVAGKPVLVRVKDSATDDLLLATVYQDQILFTPVDKTLSNAPDVETGGGDEDDDDSGGSTGDGGGSNSSGAGLSRSGGGAASWMLLGVLLLLGRLRFGERRVRPHW